MSRKPKTILTADQKDRLYQELKAGGDRLALAEKYGVSGSTVFSIIRAREGAKPGKGRPISTGRGPMTPEKLQAINESIRKGKTVAEIRKLHGLSQSAAYRARNRLEAASVQTNGHAAPADPDLTPEQIGRVLDVLKRLGEKRPDVFTKLGIVQKLAQYPMVLVEVL